MMDKENNISVVVWCLAYNQAQFISQCLDGIVMQQTTFPFYAVVHDDASTDGTAEIIKSYAEKYPEIIHPILETENQWSKNNCALETILAKVVSEAKYFAICEGDDYWIDPLKLQKQVDFLECHTDYAVCCHHVKVLNAETGTFESDDDLYDGVPEDFTIAELAAGNCIHTPSVLYRYNLKALEKLCRMGGGMVKDYAIHMFHAEHGKIKRLDDEMAVYRKGVGVWTRKEFVNVNRELEWMVCISKIAAMLDNAESQTILEKQIAERKRILVNSFESIQLENERLRSTKAFRLGKAMLRPFKTISRLWNKNQS